jgi:hypothetical protein
VCVRKRATRVKYKLNLLCSSEDLSFRFGDVRMDSAAMGFENFVAKTDSIFIYRLVPALYMCDRGYAYIARS